MLVGHVTNTLKSKHQPPRSPQALHNSAAAHRPDGSNPDFQRLAPRIHVVTAYAGEESRELAKRQKTYYKF